jgi:FAD-linked oxidoreductase
MPVAWQNWSGSVRATPAEIVHPATQDEMIAVVKDCRARGRKLRVVGTGHSFTPLVQTDGVLMVLDRYTGIVSVDAERGRATVRAGTPIQALGEALFGHGLAQPNLGDIDVQTIAGAISTGTHGSGATLGSLSTQVAGLTLITAAGEVLECSEETNRAIFKAAQVSLGALGIISTVTLQLVPAFTLHYVWRKESLREALAGIDRYVAGNRNFEFFWMPYTDAVLAKFMNPTGAPPRRKSLVRRFNDSVLENGVFWLMSEYARRFPAQAPAVSRVAGALMSGGTDINHSHRIFATPRLVKFQEMEYSIPAAEFVSVIEEIDATIRRRRFQVHFPIECRFVRGDDIPLSPAYGRDSAFIAVHMYRGMAYRPYFAAMEAIFKRHAGRPHWGKLHSRSAQDLPALYPQWDAFQAVRRALDPDGFFLNRHLAALFAESAPAGAPEASPAANMAPVPDLSKRPL